jgi:hypothetical protein
MKRTITISLVVALLGLPVAARGDGGKEVAQDAGSVFGTLVYAPVKASFCILGAIGSGFTYMADSKTAGKVARASCGGTWFITPNAVAGKDSVHFVGNTEPSGGDRTRVAGAPPAHK